MSKKKGKSLPPQCEEPEKNKQEPSKLVRDHTVRFSAFQTLSADEFHNLIYDHLGDLRCVQVHDGRTCDVTFCSVATVKKVTESITLILGEHEFLVYPVDKPRQIVKLTGLPFEIPQADVVEVLSLFGEVYQSERVQYKDRPYDSGDRTFLMHLTANIPRYVEVLGFEGKVFHRKQEISCTYCHMTGHVRQHCTDLVCRICGSCGHFSYSCPSRRCKKCRGDGHWARECPVPHEETMPPPVKPKKTSFSVPKSTPKPTPKPSPNPSPQTFDKAPSKSDCPRPSKPAFLPTDLAAPKPSCSWSDLSASMPIDTDPFSDSYEQPMDDVPVFPTPDSMRSHPKETEARLKQMSHAELLILKDRLEANRAKT